MTEPVERRTRSSLAQRDSPHVEPAVTFLSGMTSASREPYLLDQNWTAACVTICRDLHSRMLRLNPTRPAEWLSDCLLQEKHLTAPSAWLFLWSGVVYIKFGEWVDNGSERSWLSFDRLWLAVRAMVRLAHVLDVDITTLWWRYALCWVPFSSESCACNIAFTAICQALISNS